ncbi:hypothetical protein JCM16303_006570 [Sporobolomyces ruberrimus]
MYRQSGDSAIPLQNYNQVPGGNQYGQPPMEKNYASGKPRSGGRKKWPWVVGALVLLAVILGAVLGGVFGSRAANDNKSNNVNGNANNNNNGAASAATRTKGSGNEAVVPTAIDQYGNPMYPTSTGSAKIAAPSVVSNSSLSCGSDPASGLSMTNIRDSHPLLIAPQYKWDCLPKLIAADSYMSYWNETVFGNASRFASMDPTVYAIDGGLSGSGVLDVAREVQLRIKHWAYAYRLSKDPKWVERTWQELQVAAGNTSQTFGQSNTNGDVWNGQNHFLDLAEFTEAFAIAYDWMYDAWSNEQRDAIMWSIINLGLRFGNNVYTKATGASGYSWWTTVNGNWNCVCNKGLVMGALAIVDRDPTTYSRTILDNAPANAQANCALGPSPDGTWSETANYWYFGTYSHAEMAASLISATGSDQGLLNSNDAYKLTPEYHMYVTGMQGLFNYGDCGPNKYTATANSLLFYGSQYNIPRYTLFQRDRGDAPDPMSILYYDPQVSGQFWESLALDHHFENQTDAWFSARSSWTDNDGTYIAMKAGYLQGHQTHGDLDAGDFVLDAMGERWFGELGNGDYLADGYFSKESQDSLRWTYYRKGTEGQNTLNIGSNQNVAGQPTTTYDSTGESQDALVYTPANSSTAFMTADLSEMYNDTSSAHRGIRFLNGRRQVLLRDEVTSTATVQWRSHSNATVSVSSDGKTATLTMNGKTLLAELRSPSDAVFGTAAAERTSSLPALQGGSVDQPNPGVTVLTIDIPAPTNGATIEVLFNPQWKGWTANSYVSPPDVSIASWSLTSHD